MERFSAASWRTSSYSGSQGSCVEVACADDAVSVRDTKNRSAGHITLSGDAWRCFACEVTRTAAR